VQFALAPSASGPLRLEIFDLRGRRLCARTVDAGLSGGSDDERALTWTGCDGQGEPAPSGIYLARATAGGTSSSCKFVLLRR
jgi:hypothetical protein